MSQKKTRSPGRTLLLFATSIMAAGLILMCGAEIVAQALYFFSIQPKFEQQRLSERHFYRKSDNPVLAYELMPDYAYSDASRVLSINALGLRGGPTKSLREEQTLGLFGDSVTFGTTFSQEETISAQLQRQLNDICKSITVLNFGVPGYSAREIREVFSVSTRNIRLDAAVYILNLNDFSWRNTVYEGADNGLFRMYEPPVIKAPWVVRKMIYRWVKYGSLASTSRPSSYWYRWMFEGAREATVGEIAAMHALAVERGVSFAVFILPAGVAFQDGSYSLSDVHSELTTALRDRNIIVADESELYAERPHDYFDDTDHLTLMGNRETARALAKLFLNGLSPTARKAGCVQ